MRIAFVVNKVETELAGYTTTRLALAAARNGHDAYLFGAADFIYAADGSLHAHARRPKRKRYKSLESLLGELQSAEARSERIKIDELDVLFLRNDPASDALERPWAQASGILFGQLAASRGPLVVNDPQHLAMALTKTYFQHFPEQVRPATCISRHPAEIKSFIASLRGKAVIKPLQGSGGHSVFIINEDEEANLNQMIEAVIRDGYCVAQEYLPAAVEGDVRMFVMNGQPLVHNGRYAAFRRVNQDGDIRSNMHSGGKSMPAKVTDDMLHIVAAVGPKLVRDGMFLAGLDIVQDKLIEVNVFTPGGLGSCEQFTGVDFAQVVIDELSRKVDYRQRYDESISNAELATLAQVEAGPRNGQTPSVSLPAAAAG
jgi:glutathione synthase